MFSKFFITGRCGRRVYSKLPSANSNRFDVSRFEVP